MAEQDRLELVISTTADNSGVDQATQSFEKLGKQVASTTSKKQELQKAMTELGREFPILGTLGRAAMNPIIAAVGLATLAYQQATKALDEWNRKMDEAQRKAASPDFREGMLANAAAAQEAARGTREFGAALDAATSSEDSFTRKTQTAIDKLREFNTAQAEVDDAAQGLELARVDAAQKGGKLTDEQAIVARYGIRQRYTKLKEERRRQAEDQEIALLEKELAQSKEAMPALQKEAETAKQRRDVLQGRLAQAKADYIEGQKKLIEYEQEVATALDAQAKAENAMFSARRVEGPYGSLAVQAATGDLASAQQTAAGAVGRRDAQLRLNAKNQRIIGDIEGGLPSVEADWGAARDRAIGTASRMAELESTLPGLTEQIGIRRHFRGQAAALAEGTAAVGVQGDLAQSVRQMTEQDQRLTGEIARAVQSGDSLTSGMIRALQALHQRQTQAERMLESISREGEMRAGQVARLRSP